MLTDTVSANPEPRELLGVLGLRFPRRRDYSAHLNCVSHAAGIIPRTWIALSKLPELSRSLGLRFPSLRNYPGHLDCVFHASGIIPLTWIAFSTSPELSRALGLRFPSLGD